MAAADSSVEREMLPPTGTVTLLFTDIEDRAHRGHVFKTMGDAFCAAFHTAPDALGAALEAQRALHVEPWPDGVRLRVRMALHSGAADVRDGDYFGAPLNRVARLLAAGHGEQTLVSEATHDLSRDHLPPLAAFKALGEHGLKDLARREAVFQLCHPDLPQSFPPLKSQLAPLDKETPSIACCRSST
jgi:class 3 adenylate cyclase